MTTNLSTVIKKDWTDNLVLEGIAAQVMSNWSIVNPQLATKTFTDSFGDVITATVEVPAGFALNTPTFRVGVISGGPTGIFDVTLTLDKPYSGRVLFVSRQYEVSSPPEEVIGNFALGPPSSFSAGYQLNQTAIPTQLGAWYEPIVNPGCSFLYDFVEGVSNLSFQSFRSLSTHEHDWDLTLYDPPYVDRVFIKDLASDTTIVQNHHAITGEDYPIPGTASVSRVSEFNITMRQKDVVVTGDYTIPAGTKAYSIYIETGEATINGALRPTGYLINQMHQPNGAKYSSIVIGGVTGSVHVSEVF